MKVSNISEVLESLRYECFKEKGQKRFADKHGIKQSTLSAALNGKRMPTDEMIKLAGYELKYVKTDATA